MSAKKRKRRSTTSSRTVPSGGNRDTSYGRRISQPPTSCGERQKTCTAPPNSWQHVDWGSKHSWSSTEEDEEEAVGQAERQTCPLLTTAQLTPLKAFHRHKPDFIVALASLRPPWQVEKGGNQGVRSLPSPALQTPDQTRARERTRNAGKDRFHLNDWRRIFRCSFCVRNLSQRFYISGKTVWHNCLKHQRHHHHYRYCRHRRHHHHYHHHHQYHVIMVAMLMIMMIYMAEFNTRASSQRCT